MLYKYLWQDKQVNGRRLASRATVRPQADDSINFDTFSSGCFCPWANVLFQFLVTVWGGKKKKKPNPVCNNIGEKLIIYYYSLLQFWAQLCDSQLGSLMKLQPNYEWQ